VRGENYDTTDGLSFTGILSSPTHLTNSHLFIEPTRSTFCRTLLDLNTKSVEGLQVKCRTKENDATSKKKKPFLRLCNWSSDVE